VIKQNKMINS